MDWNLFRAKAWRLARRWPLEAWEELIGPIFNRGQILTFLVAFIGTAIIVQRGDFERMDAELSSWGIAIQAFGYVLLIWAIVSAIRAPFLLVAKDREAGQWFGNRFVYHRPHLVKMLRCKATGNPQRHRIVFDHAEPNAFVYYLIELEGNPPRELYSATISAGVMLGSYTTLGQGASKGGLRIGRDCSAELVVIMQEDMVSQTFRVYCRDFSIGNPDDKDGESGIAIIK